MTKRRFTLEEANGTLPLVRSVVADIVRDYRRLGEFARDYKELRGKKDRDADHEARLNARKQQMATLSEEIDTFVSELTEIGCEMKDLELGLVDFPSELDGRTVNLCWQHGEDQVEFWHETTEGFPARKPLPVTVPES